MPFQWRNTQLILVEMCARFREWCLNTHNVQLKRLKTEHKRASKFWRYFGYYMCRSICTRHRRRAFLPERTKVVTIYANKKNMCLVHVCKQRSEVSYHIFSLSMVNASWSSNHITFSSNAVNSIYFYGFRAAIEEIMNAQNKNRCLIGLHTFRSVLLFGRISVSFDSFLLIILTTLSPLNNILLFAVRQVAFFLLFCCDDTLLFFFLAHRWIMTVRF